VAQRQRKGSPTKGGGNGVFYAVLAVIAVGGIAAIGYALVGGGSGAAATEMVTDLDVADTRALYDQAVPMRLGPADAPMKIVEFGDYQCPGCAAFSLQVRPQIMSYIESGLAQLVYYDFPLGGGHIHSFLAARATRCAAEQDLPTGDNAYWRYHDKLFQEQSTWSAKRSVADDFVAYGEELGLDGGALEECVNSERYADVVTANKLLGDQLGVRGTPTVLVNNRRIGGQTIQSMGDELLEVLQAAQQERGTGG
jgi:protein-disulfide isomerase